MIEWDSYMDLPNRGDPAPIRALEARLGVTLPDAIRQIMLDHAGDTPRPDSIGVGRRSVTPFGPILYAGGGKQDAVYTYSVEFVLASLAEWSRMDAAALTLFPFAANTASGYFCLDFREEGVPSIVFVDLGYDLEESSAILPVAADWQELTGRLR